MKDENFAELMTILKFLESQDMKKVSTEDAVINMLDRCEGELTKEQIEIIAKGFVHYERMRQARKKTHEESMKRESERLFEQDYGKY